MGGLDNKSKFHFVHSKKVCTPLNVEGLGIRSLLSIRCYWESGHGSMLWKEMLFGNRLWIKKQYFGRQ